MEQAALGDTSTDADMAEAAWLGDGAWITPGGATLPVTTHGAFAGNLTIDGQYHYASNVRGITDLGHDSGAVRVRLSTVTGSDVEEEIGELMEVDLSFFAIPNDPAALVAGKYATPETVQLVRHRLGRDRPKPVQLALFLSRAARGDLGYSYTSPQSVALALKQAFRKDGTVTAEN